MRRISLANLLPHIIACSIFLIISILYHYPAISGKRLVQNDVVQAAGSLKEATDYNAKGEKILWTNSMFSGMPIWRGPDNNVYKSLHYGMAAIFNTSILLTFLAFVGFYLMMLPMKASPVVAFLCAAAFSLSSFNIISLEAGHINKVFDMALMAPVMAGMFLAYKKKYLEGALMTLVFLGLQIYYGHFQISYYLIILIFFYFASEVVFAAMEKSWATFIKGSAILGVVAILAIIPNITKIYTNYVYSKSTTRGGSELTARQSKNDSGGLDKEYALSWSNGVDEVLTIYVPYLYGGSSHENIGRKSETAKVLKNYDPAVAKQFVAAAPLYYGPQPFTSGPVYFGAVIIFLFVVGLVVVDNRAKWWILAVSLFSLFMSMGKHFPALTNVLFDYFPLYNKFRSVTMAMSIAMVTFPLLAGLALIKIMSGEVELKKLKIGIMTGLGVCLAIVLYAVTVPDGQGYAIHTVKGTETLQQIADSTGIELQTLAELNPDSKNGLRAGMEIEIPQANYPVAILEALSEDRIAFARNDAFRSLFISALAALLIWAWYQKWFNRNVIMIGLAAVALLDLFQVDKRYLGAEDYKPAKTLERDYYALTSADEYILNDKDYFRVLNTTKNPFNDATTSYFHHSIGGYSAIKLGRYQELIENHLQRNNMAVMNMLNTRYVIMQDQKSGQLIPQRNPNALGNAWFVKEVKMVENADKEIEALNGFDPKQTVFIDKRFESQTKGLSLVYDSSAKLKFVSYHPDKLNYEYSTNSDQVIVFSEIYYQPGWNAYIDGKLTDHFRCNYVLRGMKVPAGSHKIEFRFEPAHYFTTEKIVLVGSGIVVLVFAILLFLWFKPDFSFGKKKA